MKNNEYTLITDKLPEKGVDIIGIDNRGDRYFCFRCNCQNKNCSEFRDSITGFGLLVNIIKWKVE